MQNNEYNTPQNNPEFNLREEIGSYLIHWKWFLIVTLVSLILAYTYLRYAVSQYKASTTIVVKDDKKGGLASELAAFSDLGMLSGVNSNVDNEIEVIKSRTLIASSIKALKLDITYYNIGRIKEGEMYKDKPVTMYFSKISETFSEKKHSFRVKIRTAENFTLYNSTEDLLGDFTYNKPIKIEEGTEIVILKDKEWKSDKKYDIAISYNPITDLTENYKSRLTVAALSKNSSVIELSFVDPIAEKAEDFLDMLVSNYNSDAIADKKYISENTARFIENRIQLINKELKEVESDVESFKKANKVTDLVSESGLYLENASQFEKGEIETETQLKVVATMLRYVNTASNTDLIPANIIPTEQGAAALIGEYNQLVLERNRLLKSAGSKNTLVLNLEKKTDALRANIVSSLRSLQTSLEIKRKDLAYQNSVLGGKIAQIPTQEKLFRDISRKQSIKEALYLYLLQKREETAISLAVTAPNAKIIDPAIAAKIPVSPKRSVIYLAALLLGLLIPFAVIYILKLVDTKVKTRLDVELATSMPFIGDVPKADNSNQIISTDSNSSTAEALRIIRTNLEFLLSDVHESGAKTIFLTSTFPKEGKTFVSANLASTIALSDKKVLLMGMDIRNPRLSDYFKVTNKGVTSYLASKDSDSLEEYITKVEGFSNFHVIPGGIIPPNPAELLMSKKVGLLFEKIKKEYDYIIVDTAPASLVTDTLLISKYADAFIYVVRANVLDKRMLSLPEKLYQEKKLPNMSIVINDTDSKKGYGYGYGYGYGVEEKTIPFWKKFFNR
ncbi:tyrosine-protein kinase involved in exopolysaccharide biosynthesis [Flavobacterium limnosediminis JC2902]|uniref:non-specific protein-tyrosine kinase n=1 Tax=Flavobacterium limnosediminis JC2902 TaxID=1341181 RepID=V6SKN0_9FLAO|nr:tyrosine-protein kinase family protein [Flavobacterium limnosediminis]ESU27258.1 tyrosine-protein kinase involved in exopolysaccharide biosynthesis [Flavobacterium limnosediminis JC2902]